MFEISLLEHYTGYRHAEEIALHFIAFHQAQKSGLLFRFDAFRYDVELQRVRKFDDG